MFGREKTSFANRLENGKKKRVQTFTEREREGKISNTMRKKK